MGSSTIEKKKENGKILSTQLVEEKNNKEEYEFFPSSGK